MKKKVLFFKFAVLWKPKMYKTLGGCSCVDRFQDFVIKTEQTPPCHPSRSQQTCCVIVSGSVGDVRSVLRRTNELKKTEQGFYP